MYPMYSNRSRRRNAMRTATAASQLQCIQIPVGYMLYPTTKVSNWEDISDEKLSYHWGRKWKFVLSSYPRRRPFSLIHPKSRGSSLFAIGELCLLRCIKNEKKATQVCCFRRFFWEFFNTNFSYSREKEKGWWTHPTMTNCAILPQT